MKLLILVAIFSSLNLHAEISTGVTDNTQTSINNGGGCSQTKSLSDLGILSALLAILSVPALKKRAAQHKAKK
jgi:hypothetical protein